MNKKMHTLTFSFFIFLFSSYFLFIAGINVDLKRKYQTRFIRKTLDITDNFPNLPNFNPMCSVLDASFLNPASNIFRILRKK